MAYEDYNRWIEAIKGRYPGKFGREEQYLCPDSSWRQDIYRHRLRRATVPRQQPLYSMSRSHPKAFFDAEVLQVWNLGRLPLH